MLWRSRPPSLRLRPSSGYPQSRSRIALTPGWRGLTDLDRVNRGDLAQLGSGAQVGGVAVGQQENARDRLPPEPLLNAAEGGANGRGATLEIHLRHGRSRVQGRIEIVTAQFKMLVQRLLPS